MNETRYDFVVVGSGIAGLSAAYHLAKDGYKVVVLEATDGKESASQASTAEMNHDPDADWGRVVTQFGLPGAAKVWQLSELAMEALDAFAHLPGEEHFNTGRLPAHLFSYRDGATDALREKYGFYTSIGANVAYTEDGSAFHESFRETLTILDEGATNNQMILKDLAHGVRELGGDIHHHRRVTKITYENGVPRLETDKGETFSGTRVIIATGDGRSLTPVPLPINRVRTFVISYEKHGMREAFKDSLMWDTDEPFHYVRSFDSTRLWIGGEDIAEDAYTGDEKERYARLEAYARDVLHLDDSYIRDGEWNAVFFPSVRGLPYIGEIPDSPILLSIGFGGSGILTSFISGYLHAAWLRGELLEYKPLFAADWQ